MGRVEAYYKVKIFLKLLAGFLAGTAGGMGLGGGSILLIYLTVFENVNQLTAQGINLLFFLPVALIAIIIYSKRGEIKWKRVLPIMLTGALGAALASYLVTYIDTALLRKLFGGAVIIYGISEIFKPGKQKKSSS